MFSGTYTLTEGLGTEPNQSFRHLPQWEVAETEVNLSTKLECSIEGYNITDVLRTVDMNSTSHITKPTKQKEGAFKATLSSDNLKTSN